MSATIQTVFRGDLKFAEGLPSGTGDSVLTVDDTTSEIGKIPAIDLSAYVSNTLTSGRILVGNSSNVATAVQATGAVSISDTGVVSIANNVISNTHIHTAAAIAYSKLSLSNSIMNSDIAPTAAIAKTKIADGNANRLLVSNNLGVFSDHTALTASRILLTNASGLPVAADTVTYPSLTELAYVKGVTSALQTQLAGFWNKSGTTTLTGIATITSNAANQLVFNGAWTDDGGWHFDFIPEITLDGTAAAEARMMNIRPSFIAGANNQVLTTIRIAPSYDDGAFTGVSHMALIVNGGHVSIGTDTNSALVQIAGEGTTTGELLRITDTTPTLRLLMLDNGNIGLSQANPTYQLHITGSGNNANLLLIEENGGSDILEIVETAGIPAIGFFGADPQAQATALTAPLTTVTSAAPGSPDYAIQTLVASTGYGFVTSDEAQTVISVIANLQTRLVELEGRLQDYGLLA